MNSSVLRAAGALALTAAIATAPAPHGPSRPLPPIVFVSRHPIPGDASAVPGLGPHHRADITGGRLLRLDPGGATRDLLPEGAMADVSDPAVSPDARLIAFAGVARGDSAWRIYVCSADGRGLRAVTHDPAENAGGPGARVDDLDPCWIADETMCFSSTRGAARSEYADVPAPNLFTVGIAGGEPRRITADRNGADEPAFDPRRGRIVYSRWWYNARMPSRTTRDGMTRTRAEALPGDTINVWQAVEIDPDGAGLRLAAGAPRPRRSSMGAQPCVLPGGDLAAVYALNMGLSPRGGPLGIQRLSRSLAPSRRIAGAVFDAESDSSYGTPRGLAAPAACAPAALPDGRLLIAFDPGARGDFGISVVDHEGAAPTPIVDLPGTLELDPAPLVPWPVRPRGTPTRAAANAAHAPAGAADTTPGPAGAADTFTFFCRNLFATGPLDSPVDPAPPLAWPLRVRFFETRPRPRPPGLPAADGRAATSVAPDPGDTLVLIREGVVRDDGSIRESGLPARVPMFEQVVDASGLPLATAHGGAQVPGFNFAAPGGTARCVGCHAGHSTLPADGPDSRFRIVDVAPSAEIAASSRAPGTTGPAAAADGRARGDVSRVAWVASGDSAEWLTFSWPVPVRVQRVVLHLPADDARAGTAARLDGCALTLSLKTERTGGGRLGPLGASGGSLATRGVLCDRLEIRPGRVSGRVLGRRRVAFTEVEVLGSIAPEGFGEPAGPRPASGATP